MARKSAYIFVQSRDFALNNLSDFVEQKIEQEPSRIILFNFLDHVGMLDRFAAVGRFAWVAKLKESNANDMKFVPAAAIHIFRPSEVSTQTPSNSAK